MRSTGRPVSRRRKWVRSLAQMSAEAAGATSASASRPLSCRRGLVHRAVRAVRPRRPQNDDVQRRHRGSWVGTPTTSSPAGRTGRRASAKGVALAVPKGDRGEREQEAGGRTRGGSSRGRTHSRTGRGREGAAPGPHVRGRCVRADVAALPSGPARSRGCSEARFFSPTRVSHADAENGGVGRPPRRIGPT